MSMDKINLARLKECMNRAEQGAEMTVGFLGGSITQGSLATVPENSYAARVFSWWVNSFPKTQFSYVNGGIGGTSSHYGVSRAVTDLLMYQPDFVVVDFSVNDEATPFFQETYEGVIRKILQCDSKPAVLILNNVFYDTGDSAEGLHNQIGEWYGIPHVSIRDTVYREICEGKYTREELTPDGLHPNDKGHALVAGKITDFLETVKRYKDEPETEAAFPEPMTANRYEDARRLTIRECSPVLEGFRADPEEKTGHLDHFKNGWIGKKAGDRIRFCVNASCIAVQYKKTVNRPARQAKLILDHDEQHPVLLDGNFEEDWGDCLYLQTILHHGEKAEHEVELEIISDGIEEAEPFYLMSLIVA